MCQPLNAFPLKEWSLIRMVLILGMWFQGFALAEPCATIEARPQRVSCPQKTPYCYVLLKYFQPKQRECVQAGDTIELEASTRLLLKGEVLKARPLRSSYQRLKFLKTPQLKARLRQGLGRRVHVWVIRSQPLLPDASPPSLMALRNAQDNALFALLIKSGSSTTVAGKAGLSLEVNPYDVAPFGLTLGQYHHSERSEDDLIQKSMQSAALSGGILLGANGSFLHLASSLAYRRIVVEQESQLIDHFFSFIPNAGIRLVSDSELILSIMISKNLPLGRDFEKFLGPAPSGTGIFDDAAEDLTIGVGMGI